MGSHKMEPRRRSSGPKFHNRSAVIPVAPCEYGVRSQKQRLSSVASVLIES